MMIPWKEAFQDHYIGCFNIFLEKEARSLDTEHSGAEVFKASLKSISSVF